MRAPLTVHLRAADGATFNITVPGPNVRPQVRVGDVRACSPKTTWMWDGTKWAAP